MQNVAFFYDKTCVETKITINVKIEGLKSLA
jgi:hypothetical protein